MKTQSIFLPLLGVLAGSKTDITRIFGESFPINTLVDISTG